jgi:hypothetical protein
LINFDYTKLRGNHMPIPVSSHRPLSKSTKKALATTEGMVRGFDAELAGRAIVEGLQYLKSRLEWSGTKVAHVLHLPANTLNTWLKNGTVPLHSAVLQPDMQVVVHLLAIHRSLEAMFDDPAQQRAWLETLHPELKAIPEKLMGESISGLIYVRQYLDYVRGRGA